MHPAAPACNQAIKDVNLPEECTLLAIIRHHRLIIPRGITVLEPLDEVLALVHHKRLNEFAALLAPRSK